MSQTILEIRPDLRIEIYTVPGSARIRWNLPGNPPCMFDPTDGSWHPYDQDDPLEILSRISPTDIAQIVFRLLRFSENRRLHITGLNAS